METKNQVGFRIYQDIKRPPQELVEAFRGISSCCVSDQTSRMYCLSPSLRPLTMQPLLGVALTVRTSQGDNLMIHKAIDMAQPGDVIVVSAGGQSARSVVGEMMVRHAAARGVAGFVIDGMTRDPAGIREAGIPVYSLGNVILGSLRAGPGEINVPISCGGSVVMPGDIILGDADGIVSLRPADAKEIVGVAREKHEKELAKQVKYRAGAVSASDRSWIDKALSEKRVPVLGRWGADDES